MNFDEAMFAHIFNPQTVIEEKPVVRDLPPLETNQVEEETCSGQ